MFSNAGSGHVMSVIQLSWGLVLWVLCHKKREQSQIRISVESLIILLIHSKAFYEVFPQSSWDIQNILETLSTYSSRFLIIFKISSHSFKSFKINFTEGNNRNTNFFALLILMAEIKSAEVTVVLSQVHLELVLSKCFNSTMSGTGRLGPRWIPAAWDQRRRRTGEPVRELPII